MPEPIFRAVFVALMAAALVAGGCGGEKEATPSGTTGEATSQSTTDLTTTTTSSEDATAAGKEVFTSNCSSCHTLADAGATGSVGPNLDELKPDETTVESKVKSGGGGMPSFSDELTEAQISAVAEYVATSAG